MDLSHVFGFPLWEKAVFRLLNRAFGDISSIFAAHAPAAGRMPQSMLTSLARECGLVTEGFPMARVRSVFQRAGQPVHQHRRLVIRDDEGRSQQNVIAASAVDRA